MNKAVVDRVFYPVHKWNLLQIYFYNFLQHIILDLQKKFFLSVGLFGAYRLISRIGTSFTFIFAEVNLPLLSTLYDYIV